jgi:cytochrome c-type biogenesis protein CcmH/NrfF
MNPSQVKEYEQMYLNKGYSQQQIDLIKNRYGNQFRSPYKPIHKLQIQCNFGNPIRLNPSFQTAVVILFL